MNPPTLPAQPLRSLRACFILSALVSLAAMVLLLPGKGLISGLGWLVPGVLFTAAVASAAGAMLLFLPEQEERLAGRFSRLASQTLALGIAFFTLLVLFLTGLMFWASASPILYGPVYPVWLVPFFAWLTIQSLLGLVCLTWLQPVPYLPSLPALLLLLVILASGMLVILRLWNFPTPRQEDIYFIYLDGQRLLNGENPYARVLGANMSVNDKYATYLPIFYGLSWLAQKLGLQDFPRWLDFWRGVFTLFNLLIAAVLFWVAGRGASEKETEENRSSLRRWGRVALAAFAAIFWLFNRWTLHVSQTGDIDFLPLLLLILSLYALPRHRVAAYLLLGLSLGIKQMGIFLVPLYLVWAWRKGGERRWREVVLAAAWIALVPFLASLPFLLWSGKGFLLSVLISATRSPSVTFEVYSLDALLGVAGIRGRLLMLGLMALIYWIAYRYRLGGGPGRYTAVLLVLAVFVFFNTVLFTSYLVWLVPFIPLAVVEVLDGRRGWDSPRMRANP